MTPADKLGPYRAFYRATVISLGVGALLLLVALAHGTDVPSGGLIWLGAYGVTRVAIAFFPTDLEGECVPDVGERLVAHFTPPAWSRTGRCLPNP